MRIDSRLRGMAAGLALFIAPGALAQSSDSILSRNIREADGSTGQDTNSGAGVKTDHIQNGAVTGAKLAPAAVGTGALADGAVTGAKLAPAAVGTSALVDGAVTDAKIAGPIAAAKISRAGLDADTVDGQHLSALSLVNHGHELDHVFQLPEELGARARKVRNVIVVAKDGENPDPVAAVAAIADASESNPYLIKIMPGRYELTAPLQLPGNVHLEGSGRGVTTLVGRSSAPELAATGVVLMALYGSSVSGLTVESDGIPYGLMGSGRFANLEVLVGGSTQDIAMGGAALGVMLFAGELTDSRVVVTPTATGDWSHGIAVSYGTTVKISRVDVTVVGPDGSRPNYGYNGAIGLNVSYNSVATVSDSRFSVTGAHIARGIGPGTIDARDVVVSVSSPLDPSGSKGFYASGESSLSNSVVDAGPAGMAVEASARPAILRVANSKVGGGFSSPYPDSVFRCIANYDAELTPVACPQP